MAKLEMLTPKALRTRAALIDAAKSMIGREGVAAVNVMTICAAASVGRTSFYNYFTDIDAVITAVAMDSAADIKARFDDLHKGVPRGLARLEDCLGMILTLATTERDTVLLLTALAHTTPDLTAMIEAEIIAELRAAQVSADGNTPALARYLTITTLALARQLAIGALPDDSVPQHLAYLMRACG